MNSNLEALRHLVGSTLTGWRGSACFRPAAVQPAQLLELYDIESSPYCRMVRETLSELDIDVLIKPCPKGGTRFRKEAIARVGKAQFPLLVDPNTDTVMLESADIIDYLLRTYGGREQVPARGIGRTARLAGGYMATVVNWRPGGIGGLTAEPSEAPAQPLELFSFETSPFSKGVRMRLCELEIPYRLRNTAKGAWSDMGPAVFRDKLFKGPRNTTRNRTWLNEHTGAVQVPYLIDPNTEVAMYESADIVDYLDNTYALDA
ncbi:glutathione S-transferase N-terminal domain-containing protein [Polycyclovorans algicola]|uniref:glutathione S-transferase N-terminal domain-containing protein n=1 Tax=Polycyclovorans algicola TaxID=616992 RepID=UPI0004A7465C|nr:glutathione S-transferase N-terminal domain-containing protein [Polycyclovorans algicola]